MNELQVPRSPATPKHLSLLGCAALGLALAAGAADAQTLLQTQTVTNRVPFEFDGTSVAVSGHTMVVGGPSLTQHTGGVVTVYQNYSGSWTVVDSFSSPNSWAGDLFGSSVAIDGQTIVVGAPGAAAPLPALQAGRAYIFSILPFCTPSGCHDSFVSYVATLDDPSPGQYDHFGTSVAVSGDVVVVGEPDRNLGTTSNAGAAFVYNRHGLNGSTPWGLTTSLFASLFDGAAAFGSAVATDGANVLVGAPSALISIGPTTRIRAGEALLYKVQSDGSAVFSDLFLAQNTQSYNGFGNSVAITPSNIAIGAPLTSTGSTTPFVDVFSNDGTGTYKFTSHVNSFFSLSAPNDRFGAALAFNGTRLAVGTPYEAVDNLTAPGAVYVYDRDATGANHWGLSQALYLDTCSISAYGGVNGYISFGWSVAFGGTTLIGGGLYASTPAATSAGAAFVFSDDEIFHDGFEVPALVCP